MLIASQAIDLIYVACSSVLVKLKNSIGKW